MKLKLLDKTIAEIGSIAVETIENDNGIESLVLGSLVVQNFSKEAAHLFLEYEDLVNNQILSRIDNAERKILELGIKVATEDGRVWEVSDLQIFGDQISFRIQGLPN